MLTSGNWSKQYSGLAVPSSHSSSSCSGSCAPARAAPVSGARGRQVGHRQQGARAHRLVDGLAECDGVEGAAAHGQRVAGPQDALRQEARLARPQGHPSARAFWPSAPKRCAELVAACAIWCTCVWGGGFYRSLDLQNAVYAVFSLGMPHGNQKVAEVFQGAGLTEAVIQACQSASRSPALLHTCAQADTIVPAAYL